MFFDNLTEEQKEQFLEERTTLIKDKIDSIKEKIEKEADDNSYRHILSYLEHHLKAELSWLKTLKST
jgi:predicted transcriptional regulator